MLLTSANTIEKSGRPRLGKNIFKERKELPGDNRVMVSFGNLNSEHMEKILTLKRSTLKNILVHMLTPTKMVLKMIQHHRGGLVLTNLLLLIFYQSRFISFTFAFGIDGIKTTIFPEEK